MNDSRFIASTLLCSGGDAREKLEQSCMNVRRNFRRGNLAAVRVGYLGRVRCKRVNAASVERSLEKTSVVAREQRFSRLG
jgi:hypothetical protein